MIYLAFSKLIFGIGQSDVPTAHYKLVFAVSRGYIYSGVIKPKLPNLVSTGKANSKIMYYCNADVKDCFNLHVLFTGAVNLNSYGKRILARVRKTFSI